MFNRQGGPYYRDLIENYGPVVRLQGAYGVSTYHPPLYAFAYNVAPQRKILYTYDPRAMHSVVVKDQYSYEQPDWFIK